MPVEFGEDGITKSWTVGSPPSYTWSCNECPTQIFGTKLHVAVEGGKNHIDEYHSGEPQIHRLKKSPVTGLEYWDTKSIRETMEAAGTPKRLTSPQALSKTSHTGDTHTFVVPNVDPYAQDVKEKELPKGFTLPKSLIGQTGPYRIMISCDCGSSGQMEAVHEKWDRACMFLAFELNAHIKKSHGRFDYDPWTGRSISEMLNQNNQLGLIIPGAPTKRKNMVRCYYCDMACLKGYDTCVLCGTYSGYSSPTSTQVKDVVRSTDIDLLQSDPELIDEPTRRTSEDAMDLKQKDHYVNIPALVGNLSVIAFNSVWFFILVFFIGATIISGGLSLAAIAVGGAGTAWTVKQGRRAKAEHEKLIVDRYQEEMKQQEIDLQKSLTVEDKQFLARQGWVPLGSSGLRSKLEYDTETGSVDWKYMQKSARHKPYEEMALDYDGVWRKAVDVKLKDAQKAIQSVKEQAANEMERAEDIRRKLNSIKAADQKKIKDIRLDRKVWK